MASTVGARYATGRIKATNAQLDIKTVGFAPRKAVVTNLTNQVLVEMNDGLEAGKNLKRIADGTLSVLSSGGIAPVTDASGNKGIRIPAGLADINDTTTEDLLWEAWG